MLSLSRTACRTLEVKTVPCNSSHGFFHPRSAELLHALSASRCPKGCTRESPTASVSSVNGVADTPVPLETRRVQLSGSFTSVDSRGLKKVPYLLYPGSPPAACRERQVRRDRKLVLSEYSRCGIRVIEPADVVRPVRVHLHGGSNVPRVAGRCATERGFREICFLVIALHCRAELMMKVLGHRGAANRDELVAHDITADQTGIEAAGANCSGNLAEPPARSSMVVPAVMNSESPEPLSQ